MEILDTGAADGKRGAEIPIADRRTDFPTLPTGRPVGRP
jgi:hypothetical protein